MEKDIMIGGVSCHFKTSAAVPRMYRIKFRRDIFTDLQSIDKEIKKQEKRITEMEEIAKESGQEFDRSQFDSELPVDTLTVFENIAYIMHKHGDKSQPADIDEWIEQFETFDIYLIFPEILAMWTAENEQTSVAKKKSEQ
ncbi:MAG: hypothetical protein IJV26_09430 [Lachnospiraceae bacterium]|nr:hypothetical protein [Lachnospiraceae bacterium]